MTEEQRQYFRNYRKANRDAMNRIQQRYRARTRTGELIKTPTCKHCGGEITPQTGRRPTYHPDCRLEAYKAERAADMAAAQQAQQQAERGSWLFRKLNERVC